MRKNDAGRRMLTRPSSVSQLSKCIRQREFNLNSFLQSNIERLAKSQQHFPAGGSSAFRPPGERVCRRGSRARRVDLGRLCPPCTSPRSLLKKRTPVITLSQRTSVKFCRRRSSLEQPSSAGAGRPCRPTGAVRDFTPSCEAKDLCCNFFRRILRWTPRLALRRRSGARIQSASATAVAGAVYGGEVASTAFLLSDARASSLACLCVRCGVSSL